MSKEIDLKKILRDWRELDHLTQQQVADSLKIKRNTYQAWEAGRSSPSISQIIELCELYNAGSVDRFLNVSPQKSADDFHDRYQHLPLREKRIVDFILKSK